MIGRVCNERYQILKNIEPGGNSNVYLAYDKILKQEVALKILKYSINEKEDLYERFTLEIKTAATLNHRNIIQIFDIGMIDERPYVVMEYIRGYNVKQLIKQRGFIDINEATMILLQVIDGLNHAHKYKIIHRDIKPQNILIKSDGTAILADFGTAFIKEEQEEKSSIILGTPHYIAPEIVRNNDCTFQSDIYSLGCTFFEMLCGTTPFKGNSVTQIAIAHVKEPFPNILKINTKIPQEYANIIYKATEKDLSNRYNNLSEMKADLLKAYQNYLNPPQSFWQKLWKRRKK